jgi:hypothetical protein
LKGPDNETRKPRSAADMKEEADRLRALFWRVFISAIFLL